MNTLYVSIGFSMNWKKRIVGIYLKELKLTALEKWIPLLITDWPKILLFLLGICMSKSERLAILKKSQVDQNILTGSSCTTDLKPNTWDLPQTLLFHTLIFMF